VKRIATKNKTVQLNRYIIGKKEIQRRKINVLNLHESENSVHHTQHHAQHTQKITKREREKIKGERGFTHEGKRIIIFFKNLNVTNSI
jgi:hypothetical protein